MMDQGKAMMTYSKLSEETLKRFGRDLLASYRSGDGRYENLDIAVVTHTRRGRVVRDAAIAEWVENTMQAIIHRIKTCHGELAPLGHPDYGSRHHKLVGEPNTAHNRKLIKLYILQALAAEPRIVKVMRADIDYGRRRNPSLVTIVLDLKLGLEGEVINLVVPFYFDMQAEEAS